MLSATDFFDLDKTDHSAIFENTRYVWEALNNINSYIQLRFNNDLIPNGQSFKVHSSTVIDGDNIYIGEGTKIEPSVYIAGPTIIGRNVQIRQGAYIRGNVIIADNAIIGHTTEVKNSIILEHGQAPHFAYVGDSILGRNTNLGAGTKLSNLPVNSFKDIDTGERPTIKFTLNGQIFDTQLDKLGAIIGDDVQTGCNCVTNPGCLIGPRTLIYPLVSLAKGYYPADSVIKLRQQLELVDRL